MVILGLVYLGSNCAGVDSVVLIAHVDILLVYKNRHGDYTNFLPNFFPCFLA